MNSHSDGFHQTGLPHIMNDDKSTISESIQAIGQKILEKANTLQAEQQTLDQLTILESSLSRSVQDCTDHHTHIRKELLEVLRDRYGLELKTLQIALERKEVLERLDSYKKQIEIHENEFNSLKDLHEEEVKIMSPHLCKIRLYQMKMMSSLEKKQEEKRNIQEQMDDLQTKHERNLTDAADYINSLDQIENEIRYLEDLERSEDEEIAALGFQIKAMLDKKSSLRNVLYETRQRNEVGNERMRLWEEELMRIRGSI